MLEEEEEDSDILENNFLKLNSNNLTDSISITALNDDASTYMGVKSAADEQNVNTKAAKNKNKNIKKDTNHKKKKKKKEDSFSSLSESKSSESPKEKRNSFTDLLKKVKKNKEKKEDKKDKEVKEEKNIKKNKGSGKKVKKVEEVETKFEWEEGGDEVYVSGSFCNWKKYYIMTKDDDGIFHLSLSLPRGFHQYKFKVDDNWTYSKTQPKYEDNGNVNNFIDTTDYTNLNEYEKNNEKEKEIELFDKTKDVKKKTKKNNARKLKKTNSSILSVNFLNSLNYYTIYYPLKSEFNKNPVPLPGLYKTCFILNEDFKQKEEKKYAEAEFINSTSTIASSERSLPNVQNKTSFLGEVVPYVKFQNLYHIHSNHLHSKLFHNYMKTITNSMTSRYRFKFTTFIYYKSNQPAKKIKRRKNHSKTVKCQTLKNDK
jgi:hypothetical protein